MYKILVFFENEKKKGTTQNSDCAFWSLLSSIKLSRTISDSNHRSELCAVKNVTSDQTKPPELRWECKCCWMHHQRKEAHANTHLKEKVEGKERSKKNPYVHNVNCVQFVSIETICILQIFFFASVFIFRAFHSICIFNNIILHYIGMWTWCFLFGSTNMRFDR